MTKTGCSPETNKAFLSPWCYRGKPTIMAHQEKTNKNTKKVATKPAKVAGQLVLPKYARNESGITPPDLAPKAKKGRK
ncbi:hypothetical protein ACFSUS_21495 [Spirosoma soli]|uniref:Uncharacterized protein n=1 Tax=Spirosoma soli TaxID=1770529 RepID=A0ABW5MCG8_9BACT